MSLKTPSKTGAAGDCCVEGRRRVAHRAEAACGWFALRVPHGETSRRADALIGHVRFDERGWETERCRMAQATAPILDSTLANNPTAPMFVRFWTKATRLLDRPTPPQRRLAQKKEGHVLKTKRPESEDPGIIPRPSYCELLQAYIGKYSTHVSVTTTSCAGYQ